MSATRFNNSNAQHLYWTNVFDQEFPLTVMVWVFPVGGPSAGNYHDILCVATSSASAGTGVGLFHTGGSVKWNLGTPTQDNPGSTTVTTNRWYHLALVVQDLTTRVMYVDGVKIATTTAADGGGVDFLLGKFGSANGSSSCNARVFAAKSWQSALTAPEIHAEMWRVYPVRTRDVRVWSPVESYNKAFDFGPLAKQYTKGVETVAAEDHKHGLIWVPPVTRPRKLTLRNGDTALVLSGDTVGSVTPEASGSLTVMDVLQVTGDTAGSTTSASTGTLTLTPISFLSGSTAGTATPAGTASLTATQPDYFPESKFTDDFDRATLDSDWENNYGGWTIVGNKLVVDDAVGGHRLNYVDPAVVTALHARVSVREYGLATTAGGPIARNTPGFSGGYYVNCFTDGDGDHLYLFKLNGGTYTELGHSQAFTRVEGGKITLEVGDGEDDPNVQRAYYDDELLLTAADTELSTGTQVGMQSYRQPGYTNTYDDFEVFGPSTVTSTLSGDTVKAVTPSGTGSLHLVRTLSGGTSKTVTPSAAGTLTVTTPMRTLGGSTSKVVTPTATGSMTVTTVTRTLSGATANPTLPISRSLPADSTSYADTGLRPGTTYYYRIKATNEQGESVWSNTASATTNA